MCSSSTASEKKKKRQRLPICALPNATELITPHLLARTSSHPRAGRSPLRRSIPHGRSDCCPCSTASTHRSYTSTRTFLWRRQAAAGLVLPTKPEQLTAASSREELCQTVGKKLLKTGMETAGTTQRPRKKNHTDLCSKTSTLPYIYFSSPVCTILLFICLLCSEATAEL